MASEKDPPPVAADSDEGASSLHFEIASDGTIIGANAVAEQITGRRLSGAKIEEVVVDFTGTFDPAALADDPSAEHLFNIAGASGLPQSFYFTFRRDRDTIHVFGRLDTGEIESMRREIVTLNQELANAMRALHKSNAQLQQLNEEKNRFLGMAAHDLRKPIGVVLSYSDFLIDETRGLLDGEQLGFLDTINSASLHMKQLVDSFLDVSAIEAGVFELDLQPASLADTVEHGLVMNSIQADRKEISLLVKKEAELPKVVMDSSKIEQVITNLVSNAIDCSNSGDTVTVTITSDDTSAVVSVTDEGSGIRAEEQARLFKPFATNRSGKADGTRGTGLGLLISRKIIEAHGGRIRIESTEGNGTTVGFHLPLKTEG